MSKRFWALLGMILAAVLTLSACTSSGTPAQNDNAKARKAAQVANQSFKAPVIHNFVEYNNYVKKYKLDDDPNNILWCTTSWGTTNAPLVTVPIAGKLTSSSVSLFPSTKVENYDSNSSGTYNPELPQADGMYHGNPGPYRYGFTPGGQYVDFTNMEVFCTTALTKFQKDKTEVDVNYDSAVGAAQVIASKELAKCQAAANTGLGANPGDRCAAAQKALQAAVGTGK